MYPPFVLRPSRCARFLIAARWPASNPFALILRPTDRSICEGRTRTFLGVGIMPAFTFLSVICAFFSKRDAAVAIILLSPSAVSFICSDSILET